MLTQEPASYALSLCMVAWIERLALTQVCGPANIIILQDVISAMRSIQTDCIHSVVDVHTSTKALLQLLNHCTAHCGLPVVAASMCAQHLRPIANMYLSHTVCTINQDDGVHG